MANNFLGKTFNVVLFEPEIPQNTGNIIRTCACTGCDLFLIGRLGFSLSDKYLKRCGLDYHDSTNIRQFNNLEDFYNEFPEGRFFYLTTKSKKKYTDFKFEKNDFFIFGPETRGLPEDLLKINEQTAITIPMREGQRSLNLSNSVAIVVYEAIRQIGV